MHKIGWNNKREKETERKQKGLPLETEDLNNREKETEEKQEGLPLETEDLNYKLSHRFRSKNGYHKIIPEFSSLTRAILHWTELLFVMR